MFSLSLPKNILCKTYGQQVYITVDTILYLYALPINSFFTLIQVFA